MRISAKISCTVALALSLSVSGHAQFFTAGDDPGRTRWKSMESAHFRLIYPEGMDSTAREYGRNLEFYRPGVGRSIHYLPGEFTRGKMPVVFHPFNSYSNGSVAWAPHRMDLYTQPEAYGSFAMSWDRMLAVHESRHVAQMQFGLSHALRPFGWFFGEMIGGGACGLYGHLCFLEGDAVCTETALTPAGRGRNADFLNYYRIAFDNGDFRSLYKWSHSSQTRYVPNEYALGYMLLGGIRWLYDTPDFAGRFYEHAARRPYDFKYTTITKAVTGKNLSRTFDEVRDTLTTIWKSEMDSRRPYTPMEQVTSVRRGFEQYSDLAVEGDRLLARRKSLYRTADLVSISGEGRVRRLAKAASYSSPFVADSGRIWWSETFSSARWSLSNSSVIRYSDGKHRRSGTLVRHGKLYNPAVSPDGRTIAAVSYPDMGGFRVEFFDREGNGTGWSALPGRLQPTELAWTESGLVAACVGDNGFGLYSLGADGVWTAVLGPEPVSITELSTGPSGRLVFTCDRTGVDEMYTIRPDGSDLRQETSTRYGAHGFRFSGDGSTVFCIVPGLRGDMVYRTPADSLLGRPADFSERHSYIIADCLAEQERRCACPEIDRDTVSFSEAVKYGKLRHLVNVHSWAPVYFNVRNIMDMDYDHYYDLASLGTAAIAQNLLGTFTAGFGYSAHKDPVDRKMWRHSAHADFKYTGWAPVIEASLDFNDRAAYDYGLLEVTEEKTAEGEYSRISRQSIRSERPFLNAWAAISLPLSWSRGGIYSGFTPRISYSVSNDRFSTGTVVWKSSPEDFAETGNFRRLTGLTPGRTFPNQYATASMRAYVMQGTAASGVYPRLGIGAEVGVVQHFGLKAEEPVGKDFYSPTLYCLAYGYLPGILAEQGLKLTARYQKSLSTASLYWSGAVGVTPRGMARSSAGQRIAGMGWSGAVTADYAVPIPLGDLSIGRGVLDFKRLVLTPFFDGCICQKGTLMSAGASLSIDFGGILWHNFNFSAGICAAYNGGSAYSWFERSGSPIGRAFVGPLFSIDM